MVMVVGGISLHMDAAVWLQVVGVFPKVTRSTVQLTTKRAVRPSTHGLSLDQPTYWNEFQIDTCVSERLAFILEVC